MSDTLRVTNIAPNGSSLQILGTSNFQTSAGVSAFTVGNDSSCIVHGDHWAIGNVGSAGASGNWSTLGQNLYFCGGFGSQTTTTVNYKSCCISWNGQYVLFTVTNAGYGPYFSNNGGRSLSIISPAASNVGSYWGSAMSASGQYILVANTTTVWLSSNYLPMNLTATFSYSGYTSVLSVTSTNNSLSMSASGQYCVFAYTASATTGGIYLSSNYGVTWALVSGTNFPWTSVSISSSGQYITACCNGTPNNIYISSNWGSSFVLPTTTLSSITNWVSVKVSASAQWQIACANTAIYYSSNYGVTWTAVGANITLPSGSTWGAVAISPNGRYMTVTNNAAISYIFTNSNYGVGAWTQGSGTFEVGYFLAMSATGTIAIVSNGGSVLMSALSSTATTSLAPSLLLGNHPSVAANAMLTVNSTAGNGLIYLGTNSAVPAAGFFGGAGDKLILYSGTASGYPCSIGISAYTLWNSVPSGNQFQWFNNGTAHMTLNSSGQLGIGVSTPISAQLHIVAGGSADRNSCLRIKNTNVGQSGITLDGTSAVSGHQYNIWTTAAGELNPVGGLSIYDDTAGAYRMVISSGGNVGIGTAVPSTTLHVNGTVTASGYALSSNVSVSQQGYTMLPGNVRMQWGYVNIQYTGGSQGFSVSFPVSFTSSCYSVTITPTDPGYGYSYINYGYGAGTITTTTFTIYMKNVNGTSAITTTGLYFSYIAIGN